MTAKRMIAGFLSFLMGLTLIIVILLTTIELISFDRDFYRREYQKLNSAETIGMSDQDLTMATEGLLSYIQGDRDNLVMEAVINGQQREVFNQKEIMHMVDVQRLYDLGYEARKAGVFLLILLLGSSLYVSRKKFWEYWAGGYLTGAGVFLLLLAAAGLAISRDFLWFWNNFHYLIFTNDLWLLDPNTDILIQMVPEQFFFDLVVRILSAFTLALALLAAAAAGILWKRKRGI